MKNYTDLVTSAAPTAAARVRLRPVDARGVAIRACAYPGKQYSYPYRHGTVCSRTGNG